MSTHSTAKSETVLPGESLTQIAEVSNFLEAYEARHGERPERRFLLIGSDTGEQVELPEQVYNVLTRAVDALSQGKAVTIAPQEPRLTTQQAADLLGVSRPTVVRLIESGDLAAERVDSRRRLALSEVLAHRERRRARQLAMLDATATDFRNEEDPAEMIELGREARKNVARQPEFAGRKRSVPGAEVVENAAPKAPKIRTQRNSKTGTFVSARRHPKTSKSQKA